MIWLVSKHFLYRNPGANTKVTTELKWNWHIKLSCRGKWTLSSLPWHLVCQWLLHDKIVREQNRLRTWHFVSFIGWLTYVCQLYVWLRMLSFHSWMQILVWTSDSHKSFQSCRNNYIFLISYPKNFIIKKKKCFTISCWIRHVLVYLSEDIRIYNSRKWYGRNSDRKGKDYKGYSSHALEKAIVAVLIGKMNGRQAAQFYGVPVGTVYDRVAKTKTEKN